jgi:putative ABC transport system permease protein
MRTALLALADLWHERVLAACTILSLAAVLAPLLVLAGLRAGVIAGLRQSILDDPHAREIYTIANRTLTEAELAALAARPDVAFLAPRTLTISETLLLERPDGPGEGVRVELIGSAPGDPLLPQPPRADDQIVLTAAAAAQLHVGPGAHLIGRLARTSDGVRQAVPLQLVVATVAPAAAFSRPAAYVTLRLEVMVEDFLNGVIPPPPADLAGLPPVHRASFAGFRLYARRLQDVPVLDSALNAAGYAVYSQAGQVATLSMVDRNLTLLLAIVAALGGGGYLVSLGASLWANVKRKRASLALLRFLGLGTVSLCLFPAVQAAMLAIGGSAVAIGAALSVARLINVGFAGTMGLDRPLCLIAPEIAVDAAALTVLGGVVVAGVAGLLAARVDAWEGVTGA